MILEQKKGPFSEGASFRVGAVDGRGYVHIGVQIPKSQPIEYINSVVPTDVLIETENSAKEYKVNKTGILEFDANVGNSVKITILRDLPAESIIDLVYRPEGE